MIKDEYDSDDPIKLGEVGPEFKEMLWDIEKMKKKNKIEQAREIIAAAQTEDSVIRRGEMYKRASEIMKENDLQKSDPKELRARVISGGRGAASEQTEMKWNTRPLGYNKYKFAEDGLLTLSIRELLSKLKKIPMVSTLNQLAQRYPDQFREFKRDINYVQNLGDDDDQDSLTAQDMIILEKITGLQEYIAVCHKNVTHLFLQLYLYLDYLFKRWRAPEMRIYQKYIEKLLEEYHGFDPYQLLFYESVKIDEMNSSAEAIANSVEDYFISDEFEQRQTRIRMEREQAQSGEGPRVFAVKTEDLKKKDEHAIDTIKVNAISVASAASPSGAVLGRRNEIEKLQSIAQEKDKRLSQMEKHLKQSNKEIATLSSDLDKFKTKLELQEDEEENIVKSKNEHISDLTKKVSELNATIAPLQDEIKAEKFARERLQGQLRALKKAEASAASLQLPNVEKIMDNGGLGMDIFDTDKPATNCHLLKDTVEEIAKASKDAIKRAKDLAISINYNLVTNRFGSIAQVRKGLAIINGIERMISFAMSKITMDDIGRPEIFVKFTVKMQTFAGDHALGKVAGATSIEPGSKTTLTKQTTEVKRERYETSQSALESSSESPREEFQTAVEENASEEQSKSIEETEERDVSTSQSKDTSAHVDTSVSGGMKTGIYSVNASVSAGYAQNTSKSRDENQNNSKSIAQDMTTALDTMQSTAENKSKEKSSSRESKVSETRETEVESENVSGSIQIVENFNHDTVLNINHYQLMRERISILSIVDASVIIKTFNTIDQVKLSSAEDRLKQIFLADEAERLWGDIKGVFSKQLDYKGRALNILKTQMNGIVTLNNDSFMEILKDNGIYGSELSASDKNYQDIFERVSGIVSRMFVTYTNCNGINGIAFCDDKVAYGKEKLEQLKNNLIREKLLLDKMEYEVEMVGQDAQMNKYKTEAFQEVKESLREISDAKERVKYLLYMLSDIKDPYTKKQLYYLMQDEDDSRPKINLNGVALD